MNNGNAIIISGTILALSIVGGASLLERSIDSASSRLADLGPAIGKLRVAGAPNRPSPPSPQRRRGPDPDKVYRPAIEGAPAKGPASAKVTLVAFSDFQCPFCGRVLPALEQVRQEYGDDVRIVFKHLPLSIHPKAAKAHAAAEAAKGQGKFWEMHDLIFENQSQLSEEKYIEYADQIGLDVERFKRDLASAEIKKRVDADSREAARLGVTGTPGFFINGRFMAGAKPFSAFKRMIDAQLEDG